MTSSKSTKRALLTSALALLMCVTMLIGATFAWFTDTASTAVNKIQAGNLKVDLEMQKPDGSWESAEGKTLEWKTADNRAQTDILWEPGCTYELPQLRVVNKGNLALKYKVVFSAINGDEDAMKLAEVLDVSLNGNKVGTLKDALTSTDPDGFAHGNLPAEGTSGELKITVQMQTTAGNDYQGLSIGGIAVTLLATQDTVESDSFGNTYDKHAKYPDVAYTQASTQDELNTALNNPTDANGNPTSKIAVDLKKGSYTLPGDKMGNKEISITGTEDTVIDLKKGTAAHDASITMEGVTVESTNGNYTGIQHAAATTFKDCVIKGQPFLYAKNVQYINCTFEQDSSSAYNVWTYGAGNVLFKDCTFNCAGKSVLIYNEGSINRQTVEFQNCKFNASAPVAGKAAIEIDSSLLPDGGIYKVIIDQATADNVTGFDNGSVSNSNVWNNKKGTKATVIVAGSTVLSAS